MSHPRLEAAQRAVLRSERQVGYLCKSRRDPPEVGVMYRNDRAGGGMPSDQTVGLFIRIPFATDARNLPRETAAQTELMTARAELDRTERIVRSDIDAALAVLSLAEQHLKLTEERSATLSERAAPVDGSRQRPRRSASLTDAIAINKMHAWEIQVRSPSGEGIGRPHQH